VWKSVGVMVMLVFAAVMRKMVARLVGGNEARVDQLTLAKNVLLATYAVVAVLTFAIPNFPVVSAVVEMGIIVLVVLSVWWDFTKFVLASNEAFGSVASSVVSFSNPNLRADKAAQRAKKTSGDSCRCFCS
jgi:hypothetical protein